MQIVKGKGSKTHHLVAKEVPVNGATLKSVMFETHCGQFFLREHGAIVEDAPIEAMQKLIDAGTFCKRCTKYLQANLKPPLEDPWLTQLRSAIQDGMVALDGWNAFFGNTGTIDFYVLDSDEKLEEHPNALIKAFQYLIENNAAILTSLLTQFLPIYNEWRHSKDYGLSSEEQLQLMPPVTEVHQFAKFLRPSGIRIHWKIKKGISYTGYTFDVPWEEEHGLGVLMWCDKPEAFGPKDIAIG